MSNSSDLDLMMQALKLGMTIGRAMKNQDLDIDRAMTSQNFDTERFWINQGDGPRRNLKDGEWAIAHGGLSSDFPFVLIGPCAINVQWYHIFDIPFPRAE